MATNAFYAENENKTRSPWILRRLVWVFNFINVKNILFLKNFFIMVSG